MQGVFTALVTPFDSSNNIDWGAFTRLVQDQVSAGVDGLVVCGSTGETPTLSLEEKKALILAAQKELRGSPVRLIVGTGTNNTAESLDFSKWASDQGVSAVMLVTPYYNKPSQKGLETHFLQIADAVSCEVILYNVPGRTGVSLGAETIAKLAKHEKIRTIKEATGNLMFASEILDLQRGFSRPIEILSGDDGTFLPLLSIGAVGVISVASNLFPRKMVALWKAFRAGDLAKAAQLHQHYYPLFRDLFIETNPVPVKYALEKRGLCSARVRMPLVELSASSIEALDRSLRVCQIERGSLV